MDRIRYAGGELLTGSEIAEAVVAYAAALGRSNSAASIDIPVRTNGGTTRRAHLLVGPASQLVTEPVDTDLEELVDAALVAELRAATTALVPHPLVDRMQIDDADTDELEWPPAR
ncbi:hypothetical protein EDM22_14765 [Agromyces tardus]|jgi:hypothetical protein|uniref:Uncharacterized protein n=1 Tax=Agromyces tardus TaxID=2583849 RepID=A0A3M8A4B7_9MICO|nr:hypothetical protein [Agromyces tardus]RNB46053.1 hypothetical protein EDM22_14765 [Agromyces tardus]